MSDREPKTDAFRIPEAEKARRITATSPQVNAWIAANAGSGKTTVLRNRVIRLLLAGVQPDQLLCLTFTKAAAAEMQNRIFKELAAWVSAPDDALDAAITTLTGMPVSRYERALARRLFALAVEAPGGLKIQTIHAFSERILHLFPLEAGVPVDFTVLDEGQSADLKTAARKAVLARAIAHDETALGRAFATILDASGLESFEKATHEALSCLGKIRARSPSGTSGQDLSEQRYEAAFECSSQTEPEMLDAAILGDMPGQRDLIRWIDSITSSAKTKTMRELGDTLRSIARQSPHDRSQKEWISVFFTTKMEPRKKFLTKEIDADFPDLWFEFEAEQARLLALKSARKRVVSLRRSRAMLIFANEVLDHYMMQKKARNALDFDDLIAGLRRMLLKDSSAWIMMKLDAAIDHILVDEAQDTTPDMWDIIRALADDFFSGDGQRRVKRTIFVVGDEKQSIYSFQGAKPEVFDATYAHFASAIRASGEPQELDRVVLNSSFRSSADLMHGVNTIFEDPARRAGLTASGAWDHHHSAFVHKPGLIEIWPPILREKQIDPADSDAPVDQAQPSAPALVLAEKIAGRIHFWLDRGARHFSDHTLITPGDILILVRNRNATFEAILRALKRLNVPVAGADRLRPAEEIAVQDLLAIAQSALLPDDDLTLAIVLKSPLCGMEETDLERLARGRSGSLWERLCGSDQPKHKMIVTWLIACHHQARHETPFAFFAHLLNQPCPNQPSGTRILSGRKALLTRLGHDCADAVDALLADALSFTQMHPPSLLTFIAQQKAREQAIKRDLDQSGDQVRIMTVHGAKGLEGKIVFLADTWATPNRSKEDSVLLLQEETHPLLAWAGSKGEEAEVMSAARAQAARQAMQEYRRLLYVATTRAAERLYITTCQVGSGAEPKPESWYGLLKEGLAQAQPAPDEEGDGTVLRFSQSALPPFNYALLGQESAEPRLLPTWLTSPALAETAPLPPLRPSRMADPAAARQPLDPKRLFAQQRGMLTHILFEFLPRAVPDTRANIAQALIAQSGFTLAQELLAPLIDQVIAVLATADGQLYFGDNAQAEVAVAGDVRLLSGESVPVCARIDRLILEADTLTILDIKTSEKLRSGTQRPEILRQMALYQALMQAIYPNHIISCIIFWTVDGRFETLHPDDLAAAFAQITPN